MKNIEINIGIDFSRRIITSTWKNYIEALLLKFPYLVFYDPFKNCPSTMKENPVKLGNFYGHAIISCSKEADIYAVNNDRRLIQLFTQINETGRLVRDETVPRIYFRYFHGIRPMKIWENYKILESYLIREFGLSEIIKNPLILGDPYGIIPLNIQRNLMKWNILTSYSGHIVLGDDVLLVNGEQVPDSYAKAKALLVKDKEVFFSLKKKHKFTELPIFYMPQITEPLYWEIFVKEFLKSKY